MAKEKRDIHQEITDKVIAAMESGNTPWQKGFQNAGGGLPVNQAGQPYRGINVFTLMIDAMVNGYNSPMWMTFNQIKKEGGKLVKGSKSSPIVYYSPIEIKDKETGETKKIPLMKYSNVFNLDCVEGLKEGRCKEVMPDTTEAPDSVAKGFFDALPLNIKHGGNQPFYSPTGDFIQMPHFAQYDKPESYYATLGHETIHWTGYEKRLDRLSYKGRRSNEYAFEELVAELGACYICGSIGIDCDIENSAAYLNSWLTALKGDKKFIFDAASNANKAVTYLEELKAG